MTALTGPPLALDPLLPQRDELLDAERVADRLSARLGLAGPLELERCEPVRIKYRHGESLRVLYRLEIAGASHDVSARMFPGARSEEEHGRALAAATQTGELRPVVRDGELDTVFWIFPNDRRLRNLGERLDRARALAPGLDVCGTRVESYAPEKAVTAAYLDGLGRPVAYVKLHVDRTGGRTARVHECVARGLGREFRVPAVLGHSSELEALVVEAIPGRPLAALSGQERAEGYRLWGAALGRLHGLSPVDGHRFPRLEPERLTRAAEIVGRARPDLAASARALARSLRLRAALRDTDAVRLHGDAHPKNVVVDGATAALVDLDQVAGGPAAADLGSALAGLRYNAVVGALDAGTARMLELELLDGYAASAPLPSEQTLRWHTAAALLAERALRAVNRVRPAGLRRLDAILDEARAIVP